MSNKKTNTDAKFQLWGWVLFVLGVLFFMVSSIKDRDLLTTAGCILFLVGCIVFMIPLSVSKNRDDEP